MNNIFPFHVCVRVELYCIPVLITSILNLSQQSIVAANLSEKLTWLRSMVYLLLFSFLFFSLTACSLLEPIIKIKFAPVPWLFIFLYFFHNFFSLLIWTLRCMCSGKIAERKCEWVTEHGNIAQNAVWDASEWMDGCECGRQDATHRYYFRSHISKIGIISHVRFRCMFRTVQRT